MLEVQPSVDASVLEIAPDFRALSISVIAAPILNHSISKHALEEAFLSVRSGSAPWADAHLGSWADVFRKFGAKPQRTPCSAEALRKRVIRDGGLPSIDPIVNLYNAVSIKYALPIGGENYDAYVGAPRLTIAQGDESFDTVKDGVAVLELPEKGEVIWRDNVGVTCRRWNWRQGTRTRLDSGAKRMWFILESLSSMPEVELLAAGNELKSLLVQLMPQALVQSSVLTKTSANGIASG